MSFVNRFGLGIMLLSLSVYAIRGDDMLLAHTISMLLGFAALTFPGLE